MIRSPFKLRWLMCGVGAMLLAGCGGSSGSDAKSTNGGPNERPAVVEPPVVPVTATNCIEKTVPEESREVAVCWEAFKDSDGYGQLTLDPNAPVSYSAPLLTEPNSDELGDAAYFVLDLTDDGDRLVGIEVEGAPNVYPEEIAARWDEAELIPATAKVDRVPDGIRVELGTAKASRSVDVTAGSKHKWLRLELDGERLVGLVFLGQEGERRVPVTVAKILDHESDAYVPSRTSSRYPDYVNDDNVIDFGERLARKQKAASEPYRSEVDPVATEATMNAEVIEGIRAYLASLDDAPSPAETSSA